MARLRLLAVALLLLSSAGDSSAGNNKNKNKSQNKNVPMSNKAPPPKNNPTLDPRNLANLVKDILNRYEPTVNSKPIMFAVAVNIPYNQKGKKFDVNGVGVDGAAVRRRIEECQVFSRQDVVAATVLKYENVFKQCPDSPVEWEELRQGCPKARTWAEFNDPTFCPADARSRILAQMSKKNGLVDHAEYRVLQNFDLLRRGRTKDGLLLFYSLASPCDRRCTNHSHQCNILNAIGAMKDWKNYAFVFSKPFKPARQADKPTPRDDKKTNGQTLCNNVHTALTNLGRQINLNHVFRCDQRGVEGTVCVSCNDDGRVAKFCVGEEQED